MYAPHQKRVFLGAVRFQSRIVAVGKTFPKYLPSKQNVALSFKPPSKFTQ
jgi:hypothetical protein